MKIKKRYTCLVLAVISGFLASVAFGQDNPMVKAKTDLEAGRYLVEVSGCNDCHTAGYAPSGGKVPEEDWLMGDILGFRGPWGTTYPTNLRNYFQEITEEGWMLKARRLKTRPPMPWFNIRLMSDPDLRALYRYIRSLGPKGGKAPDYVPPNQEPKPPFIQWPSPPSK